MIRTNRDSESLVLSLAQLVHDKQGEEIVILDVSGPLVIADYFLIATAKNPRQAMAIARELANAGKAANKLGRISRRNVSGMDGDSGWILLDLDLVVVHIFLPETRLFYDLESLWADAVVVPFTPLDNSVAEAGTGPADDEPIWGGPPQSS